MADATKVLQAVGDAVDGSTYPTPVVITDENGNPVDVGGSTPAAGSITTAMLADRAVEPVKIKQRSLTADLFAAGVIPTVPAAPTWANISGRPTAADAIPDLAADADAATIVATVNKALAALRGFGVIAS